MCSNEKKCKYCDKTHNVKEVARIFGKEGMVYLLGYCSARCYIKHKTQ